MYWYWAQVAENMLYLTRFLKARNVANYSLPQVMEALVHWARMLA